MRTTRLMTWNNTAVIIPNETAINQMMINHSVMGKKRIDIPVSGVFMNGDFSGTQKALLEAIGATRGVLKDPPPDVVVKTINGPTVDLTIYAWVADAGEERPVSSRILEVLKPVLSALQTVSSH